MKKLLMLLGIVASTNALAFDDRREGFMLDLGIGLSNVEFDTGRFSDSVSGLATTFKIGYGFSETFQLYYVRNASWTQYDGESFVDGISGIGGNLFVDPQVYITAAIGIGDVGQTTGYSDSDEGDAYLVGLGFEPWRHHNFQLNYLNVNITNAFGSGRVYNSDAMQALYSYSFY
jgi:hypothetical protein